MPTNLVKSKQDEADWAEARRIVDKQYLDKSPDDKDKSYWKLTTSIYENIKKNRGKKQMQKQASVGELLAAKIRIRKEAGGDKPIHAEVFSKWLDRQYREGKDPVEEMRRISPQQQPAGVRQPQVTSAPNQAPAPKQAPVPQQVPAPQPAPQAQSRPGSTQTGGIGAGIKNRFPSRWRSGTAATAEMPVDAWLRQQQHPIKPTTLEMPVDARLREEPQTKRNLLDYNM